MKIQKKNQRRNVMSMTKTKISMQLMRRMTTNSLLIKLGKEFQQRPFLRKINFFPVRMEVELKRKKVIMMMKNPVMMEDGNPNVGHHQERNQLLSKNNPSLSSQPFRIDLDRLVEKQEISYRMMILVSLIRRS